jgi:threonine dehydrogenase-like Zn-dependent dehydrogenase
MQLGTLDEIPPEDVAKLHTCHSCAHGQRRLCEYASLGLGPQGIGGGWGDGYSAHETEVYLVPDELNDEQAVLVEPTAVELHGALRRPPMNGEHVLIIGAGIIGLMTVQIVKILAPECNLTALARYPHQAELAGHMGVDEVLTEGDLYAELARIAGAKYYPAHLNRGMLLGGF